MKVTELKSQGLKKEFRIVVGAEQINSEMEQALRRAGERVKIPGFRPGYIPLKILKQRYGKNVQGDVLKTVINRATTEAVNAQKLRPALTPQINIEDYKDEGELTFTMAVETFPDVPEIGFDKITLDRKTFEIAESDIDEAARRIAERSPKLNRLPEGTAAKEGNVLTIDFKGTIDGVAFEGGTASDFNLELGSGQFIAGFEDQLIGAKEGDERTVKVTFPKDYPSKNLAGKDAAFAVAVKAVLEKDTPAIDDAFAKARGFADQRAFREAVRNQLVKEYDQLVRNQLKKQLFDLLEEKYDFELPSGMVEMEFKSIWDRMQQAKARGEDVGEDKSEQELKEEYRQIARRRVKLGLLLAEIGNRNKIQISRDELSRAMVQQASMFPGQEKKVMDFYRDNPDRLEDLRGPILEEKAVDFILAKVKFNDRKVTVEDLAEEEDADTSEKKKKKAGKSEEAPKKKAGGKK